MMSKRIGYIDAMRGFTMILVVYSHICHFCLGDSLLGFNATFFLFRLPCFFFISGWLFKVTDPVWSIIKKKKQGNRNRKKTLLKAIVESPKQKGQIWE